jgi:hypothetical protein
MVGAKMGPLELQDPKPVDEALRFSQTHIYVDVKIDVEGVFCAWGGLGLCFARLT